MSAAWLEFAVGQLPVLLPPGPSSEKRMTRNAIKIFPKTQIMAIKMDIPSKPNNFQGGGSKGGKG